MLVVMQVLLSLSCFCFRCFKFWRTRSFQASATPVSPGAAAPAVTVPPVASSTVISPIIPVPGPSVYFSAPPHPAPPASSSPTSPTSPPSAASGPAPSVANNNPNLPPVIAARPSTAVVPAPAVVRAASSPSWGRHGTLPEPGESSARSGGHTIIFDNELADFTQIRYNPNSTASSCVVPLLPPPPPSTPPSLSLSLSIVGVS
jgi:hypothetical protein